VWTGCTIADRIYEQDQTGSLVTSFAAFGTEPEGIGVDSADCLWNADYDTATIYQADQTGTVVSSFVAPSSAPRGLAWIRRVYLEC